MPGCAPETSAFFWPHDSRMLLLPSSVATTRSSCAAENSQPVNRKTRVEADYFIGGGAGRNCMKD